MTVYYNERDAFKAQVIREAIQAGALPAGDVDERDIKDVAADDLRGYRQCHFFAGGGFWALALRQAGWPDDREVWTGSCPCPSFSAAGKGRGFDDPRHLWPEWFRLIGERRPAAVLGEQVAAAIGHGWLDLVHSDLEGADYAVASAVLGACSVGAPHIRQRLYFCAHATNERLDGRRSSETSAGTFESERSRDAGDGAAGERQQSIGPGLEGHFGDVREWRGPGWLDPHEARSVAEAGATGGFWADCDWWYGRDGKWRPIGAGLFPLAHGGTARVGRLRMYGDAICVPIAQAFIESYVEAK